MSIYHPMHYLCSCVFPTSAQVSAESCPASVVVAARTRTHGAVASSTHGCHMPQESVRLNLANCLKIGIAIELDVHGKPLTCGSWGCGLKGMTRFFVVFVVPMIE